MRIITIILLLTLLTACTYESAEVLVDPKGRTTKIIRPITINETANSSIEVYFCPKDNCSQKFIQTLEKAQKTIHCALFDLDLEEVIKELENKSKILEVRLVIDNNNKKETEHLSFVRFDDDNQLSHNKFCIIDNNLIITGSMNPTTRGTTKNNNNLIMIESEYLSKNYEEEFDELWQKEYGKGDRILYPIIYHNNIKLENYMCPEDDCTMHIIKLLNNAEHNIFFMTFSFTNDDIGNTLVNKHEEGLVIKGIFEKSQNNRWNKKTKLEQAGIEVKWDNNKANMHHKVFIIDENTVITGSMNPTRSGNEKNDENLLIIHDKEIAKKYLEEFNSLYKQ